MILGPIWNEGELDPGMPATENMLPNRNCKMALHPKLLCQPPTIMVLTRSYPNVGCLGELHIFALRPCFMPLLQVFEMNGVGRRSVGSFAYDTIPKLGDEAREVPLRAGCLVLANPLRLSEFLPSLQGQYQRRKQKRKLTLFSYSPVAKQASS